MYTFNAVDSFHILEPQDTYIYDILPVAAGLAAISSDDSLRLLDLQSLNGPPKNSVQKINTDITCLKAFSTTPGDAELVCTAGRDGRVCIVDPRSGEKVGEVRTGKMHSPISLCLCYTEEKAKFAPITSPWRQKPGTPGFKHLKLRAVPHQHILFWCPIKRGQWTEFVFQK